MGDIDNWEQSAVSLINSLSSSDPTPGGGAAGAVSAAMGCALGEMVIGISLKSKLTGEEQKKILSANAEIISELRNELTSNISKDAKAFSEYMAAVRLPKEDAARRQKAVQEALRQAAEVPLRTAAVSARSVEILHRIKPAVSPKIMSDYFAAETLLKAAVQCSAEIVKLNLKMLKDRETAARMTEELERYLRSLNLKTN